MAKLDIRGLGLTAKKWGLRQGEDTPWERTTLDLVADALNQALREAATIVQDELGSREGGASPSLRGSALMAIIVRALYDKWVDVAEQHKKHGAADSRVRERAAVALRNLFAGGPQEDVSMRGLLRGLEEAKGEVSADLQAAEELQAVLMQFDIALSKVWARFEGTGKPMRDAFSGLQGSISAMKAATSTLQRERRGLAPATPGKGTAANDADLRKRLEWTNKSWSKDVLSMRAKGEYVYAGEVPQDLARVQMVYVPRKTKASYEGEYTFSREGTDSKTGEPSREFKRMGGGDTRIWLDGNGKITWD
jgi:hypothetical protein